jgi:hypothetical protein
MVCAGGMVFDRPYQMIDFRPGTFVVKSPTIARGG